MKFPAPRHQVGQSIATLVSGFGLGLIIGAVWERPEDFKIAVGFALAGISFLIIVFRDTRIL